jgi:hypothetical protein
VADPAEARAAALGKAAGDALRCFGEGKPEAAAGWLEVVVPAEAGTVSSDQLERVLRYMAVKTWPRLDVDSLRVELCWADTRGSRFVVRGVYRPL